MQKESPPGRRRAHNSVSSIPPDKVAVADAWIAIDRPATLELCMDPCMDLCMDLPGAEIELTVNGWNLIIPA